MIADPERGQAASTLAEAAGYGKGSVAQALDRLTMAGVVQVQPTANRLVYRLSRPAELLNVLQWLPAVFPDWSPIFRVIEAIAEFARTRSTTPLSRVAEVQQTLQRIDQDVHRLGIADQVPRATGPASVTEFEHWALTFLADQCGRGETIPTARQVTYTVHHLSFGGWMATVSQRGRQPQRIESAEDTQPAREAVGARPAEGDDMTNSSALANAILLDVLARTGVPIKRSQAGDAVARLISVEFAVELLRPMRPGQEATFTAEFVRRWYENRLQKFASTA